MRPTRIVVPACLALVLALAGSTRAQVDHGTPPSMGGLRFAADVSVAPSADGGGTIEISYAVTHDALQFLRHEGGYRARFEATAIVYDSRGRQVTGDSRREAVFVDTYVRTNSRRIARADEFVFSVAPGRYSMKIEVASLDTKAFGRVERPVNVPEMEPGKLALGTAVFERDGMNRDGTEYESAHNPARVYGEDYPDARVKIPVYGTPGTRYFLELSVTDSRGVFKKGTADTVTQTDFLTEYPYDFTVLDMEVGSYIIKAELRTLPNGEELSLRARFRVVSSPMSWGTDQELMLAQISYVASREEMEFLRSVPPEARDPLWEEFWALRDPDPVTEINEFKVEFLRRLGHVNATFRSIVDGWQTDMGRVYIQFGEPDDVDSDPVGQMLRAREVSYYHGEHTKYIFIDKEGFGEFVLIETTRI